MMHPNPFNDDLQECGIPMFGKNGTALSQEERAAIARRRGLCLKCGTKTHQVKIIGRTPLTNDDVYQGICIKCNTSAVPANVLQEWQMRNVQVAAVQPVNRFKAAGHAMRFTHGSNNHNTTRPSTATVPRRPTSGLPTTDTAASLGLSRTNSRSPPRSSSYGDSTASGGIMQSRSFGGLHHGASSSGSTFEVEDYKSLGGDSFSLLKGIRDNKDRPDVLKSKLHAFRNLAEDKAGSLNEIKGVMEMYRNDSKFIMLSAGALWGIASSCEEKKEEVVITGCVDYLLDAIRNGQAKDDSEAVQWILGAISSIACSEDNRRVITDRKGIESILEVMKKHENISAVFEWGCRALFSLIGGYEGDCDSSNFEKQISAIEDYGGIRVIVGSMKLHPSESNPIMWAVKVLLRMQDRIDPNAVARSVQMMNDDDLTSVCTRIINARVCADVVVHCEVLLLFLMSNAPNQALQHSAAACIPSVIQALTENSNHAELVEVSAEFLIEVARDNYQAKRQISELNGARIVVNGMSSSKERLQVQRALASLLWLLSADESSFDYSVLAEAKKAFELSAKTYARDPQLCEAICGFVANTAAHAQGRKDCVPVDLAIQLASSGVAATQCGKVLAATIAAFPDVADRIVQGGMCDRLLEGLRDANVDTQTSSAAALSSIIAVSDTARTKVCSSGGLGTAAAVLFASTSEDLAKHVLFLVSTIVSGGSKKALQFPNDIILAILQAVKSFPRLTKLACTTIRNVMLVTVPGFKAVSADGLVELLLEVIDDSSSSDDSVIEACGALWAYTAKQPLTNSNLISQSFRSVLGLCSRHKGDVTPFNGPVLAEASGALSSVIHCVRDSQVHITENDIDLIICILDMVIECNVENVALMDRLMDVILTLCFTSKEILIQYGVIVVVIDCMVEHEGNEVIQQVGCAILALLASTENLQVNLSIAETDGIDMIVSALAGFTDNLVIQTDACRALSHLSIDHESRMLISSQGGLILLVNAMNKYRDEVDLLEAACSALLNLSSDAEEQVLAGSSVVETVVSTMRHQLNCPRLQEKCLGVLQNVSMRSKDSKRAIADAGGVGAVTFAMKEFMGSPSVLERSFTTMWSLAVLEDNQHIIANEGGISLVINGMMANIAYEKVQKQACGCLCTLSSNSDNKTAIRDLGGVDAIVYAMWAHYNSDALLIEACRALSSLAVNVQTNEVMIASEGEFGAIMAAMRRFPNSERLQEHACVALRNFLLSADNVDIVRAQSVELEQLIHDASSRFPERCSERAKQVLASLRS